MQVYNFHYTLRHSLRLSATQDAPIADFAPAANKKAPTLDQAAASYCMTHDRIGYLTLLIQATAPQG